MSYILDSSCLAALVHSPGVLYSSQPFLLSAVLGSDFCIIMYHNRFLYSFTYLSFLTIKISLFSTYWLLLVDTHLFSFHGLLVFLVWFFPGFRSTLHFTSLFISLWIFQGPKKTPPDQLFDLFYWAVFYGLFVCFFLSLLLIKRIRGQMVSMIVNDRYIFLSVHLFARFLFYTYFSFHMDSFFD